MRKVKNTLIQFFILILIALSVIMYCNISTYKMLKVERKVEQKADTENYDKDDLEDIEDVRKFFLFYYEAKEYDIELYSYPAMGYNAREAVNKAQVLIGKYGEILLDFNKKLTFDKSSRDMILTSGAFELKLYFNVDIPLDGVSNYNTIPTGNGSWREKYDNYVFYKFGQAIEGSLINTSLQMLDLRTVTSNDKKSYEANSPIYLFSERQFSNYTKYCIYVVETKEFREFSNIKEIEVTDEFVSLEDKENYLFVYCIQHDFIIKAGKTDAEGLYWTYDPEIYLPKNFNDLFKEKLFIEHRQCNK